MWLVPGTGHHAPTARQDTAAAPVPTHPGETRFVYVLLFAAVLFNALLSAANANVAGLSSTHVVLAELLIVGCSHLYVLSRFHADMTPWYSLLGFITALAVVRMLVIGEVDVKYIRDVAIIPTFVLIGMVASRRALNRCMVIMQCVVAGFMILEASDTALYVRLFDVKSYYINTRGLTEDNFWNGESDLFVSATRSGDRFLPFLDLPRLSSIFLEPVSLGNYCIIVTVFLCAVFRSLGTGARIFMVATNVLLLVGCDGRLALVSSAAVVAGASLLGPRLARYVAVFSLPAAMAGATVLVLLAGLEPGSDNFSGRIAYTVYLAGDMGLVDYLGLSNDLLTKSVDSGVIYLIITQSLIGLSVVWAFVTHSHNTETRERSLFTLGMSFYISLTMLVSYSFLTIKTAALLWFVHGVLLQESKRRGGGDGTRVGV